MLLRLITILLPLNIFILGLFGTVLWKKNLISMLISVEIMFVAANLGFILASLVIDDAAGFAFSVIVLTLAGIEVAIGLALIILIYRRYGNVYLETVTKLKN